MDRAQRATPRVRVRAGRTGAVLLLCLHAVCVVEAICPSLQLKTTEAECRYIIGRLVACDKPMPTGTTAYFSCKPFYRLPVSEEDQVQASTCRDNGLWSPPPLNCVPECGRVKGKGETLIVDGKPVKSIVDYPWHVAIYSKEHKLGSYTQICGGSLVTAKFFISAAHCFYSKEYNGIRPAADFTAAVGKINKTWNAQEEYAQHREMTAIHTSGYGSQRLNHVKDFALVELSSELELNAQTMPVCVDWAGTLPGLRDGELGTVLGWGNLWRKELLETLQSATLPFVPTDRCLKLVPAQLVQYLLLPNDRFCAGYTNGTGGVVAHGDSGGGIAFRSPDRVWYLRGVVSVGMPDMRTLTTFTNVSTFVRWMANKLQDDDIYARSQENQIAIEIPQEYTATAMDEEQRMAYFREDLGVNNNHLHWHFSHPNSDAEMVRSVDRRGELFYYFHSQVLSRYDAGRLSNGLPRVRKISNLSEPIKEGYYPKLNSVVASRVWPARSPNTILSDINRDGLQINIDQLGRWRDRIRDSIDFGYMVTAYGEHILLNSTKGIDVLGHTMEATVSSPNAPLYGDIINFGHIVLALAHDPDNRYLESFGLMGDVGVASRDPVYYRWHSVAKDLFLRHKRTLPPYTLEELDLPGVTVSDVQVITPDQLRRNELVTFKRQIDMELSRGMDFGARPPVFSRITHMQHRPFHYRIQVENRNPNVHRAVFRIFMAPRFNEKGSTLTFEEQRVLMIELDWFATTLQKGPNVIERNSTESVVTIPWERTFRNLDENRPSGGKELGDFLYCGCGWPHHMLIPRGTTEGMPFHLFVMVGDSKREEVQQSAKLGPCSHDAPRYCGSNGGLYPDRRPMGFPFDRRARARVDTLRSFLTQNMFAQSITVRHHNVVEVPRRNITLIKPTASAAQLETPVSAGQLARPARPARTRRLSRPR